MSADTDSPVRLAHRGDLPTLVAIYNQSIPGGRITADTRAVTVAERETWFAEHQCPERPIWVYADPEDDTPLGWLSLNDFYGRPAYRITAELSIFVDRAVTGRGIGGALLRHAVTAAPRLGIRNLLAFVFHTNEAVIRLLNGHGFARWARLPELAVMPDGSRDLIIYGRTVGPDDNGTGPA